MRWPKYWSFSFSISSSKEHPGLIFFRMSWLDLLAVQGTLRSLLQHHSSKASILLRSAFFTVQLSHPYMTTGKTIALTRWTLVGKVMSLLLNILYRLVKAMVFLVVMYGCQGWTVKKAQCRRIDAFELWCWISLLMKVKEESENVSLKLNIQKTKIMASSPITSWHIDGETVETVSDFIFWGSKITADGDCSHEIIRRLLLEGKLWPT